MKTYASSSGVGWHFQDMFSSIFKKRPVRHFSSEFERMCNFIAVTRCQTSGETVSGLVQLCFVQAPKDRFKSAQDLADAIEILFDLRVPTEQIQSAIDNLLRGATLLKTGRRTLALSTEARSRLLTSGRLANDLEQRVQRKWLEHVDKAYSDLDKVLLMKVLQQYLMRMFERHGVHAAALLDPTVHNDAHYRSSLATILQSAVEVFPAEHQEPAVRAVHDFFGMIGTDEERSRYLVQLADGAFNFFTLAVAPSVSESMRSKLSELTLFFDTNFFYRLLGGQFGDQAGFARRLVEMVSEHVIPFRLRYHETTDAELSSLIARETEGLKARHWPRVLSRAGTASARLHGLQLDYHRKNAVAPLSVDAFLRPFKNFRLALRDYKIDIYRGLKPDLDTVGRMAPEYKRLEEFSGLAEKPPATLMHDLTVLATVRSLRTKANASLDAGALLITCDTSLYRFDWETAEDAGAMPCTVLPDGFCQILRRFLPQDLDFERSFAETFVLPEFRVIGSRAAGQACSKMLELLASFGESQLSEETAVRILCDDILCERLHKAHEAEFPERLRAAIIEENKALAEKKAGLERELARGKEDARTDRDRAIKGGIQEKHGLQRRVALLEFISAGSVTGLLIGLFLWSVRAVHWGWLLDHPNSGVIQVVTSLLIAALVTGAFVPWLRKPCWYSSLALMASGMFELVSK